jgi:hypothetical protein
MDNLIKDSTTLELFCWLEPGSELPGWDILKGGPFGATLASPEGRRTDTRRPADFGAELLCGISPGILPPAPLQRVSQPTACAIAVCDKNRCHDFRTKHPQRIFGKNLTCAKTSGTYTCSFHDASWLDYLRLPHSLSLSALDEVAEFYWSGKTVEEVGSPS